jgi:aspartate racemase
MYTSGSTGTPKGVAIPNRGIVRLVCDTDYVDISPTDVFLQASPVSFDASTFEIWGALLNGATLAMLPPGPISLQAISEAIEQEGVTILWLTTGLFNVMVDERLDDLKPVRQVLCGGEALSVPHVERALAGLPTTQLINGYGPTENTTFTCCYPIPRTDRFAFGVPIGVPIRGTYVRILDEKLQEVAPGTVGELVTGGLGLALGYWNRPELTAERFPADPFALDSGARIYRTGDLARCRQDGVLEFVGRRDGQVKVRGFRIELGEVETVLKSHGGVRDCAVVSPETSAAGRSLCAFVVARAGAAVTANELLTFLSARLPAHMVPTAWEFLPAMPLDANGKTDRAGLSRPRPLCARQEALPPATQAERLIASIWGETLGVHSFGIDDSFFDVGGNSLLLAQVHDRLRARMGVSLPLADMFQFPSVRSLARRIEAERRNLAQSASPTKPDRSRLQRNALSGFRKK